MSEVEQHYDRVAINYEGAYLRAGYPDPKKVQEYVSQIADYQNRPKDSCKIMDFGCGTGLVGGHLKENGFVNIFGIDISQKMLDIAQEKGSYQKLIHLRLNQDQHVETIPAEYRNECEFVTAAGLINNNYLDHKIFEQMLLCLKPGGFMVFSARYSYLGKRWYIDALSKLEESGRIKYVQHEAYFKYDQLPKPTGKFMKTPTKVYVYQKIEQNSGTKESNDDSKTDLNKLI